jgi:apolipoprotein N-acyltransferase
MSLASDNLITIFPETSIGFTKKIPSNWLTGSVRKKEGKFYNSIQFNDFFYDKRKLVPFTEFLPFEKIIKRLDFRKQIPENFFHSGEKNQIFYSSYLPLICYDGIFPNILLSSLTHEHELIINISNDAWFGKGVGPKQQLTHVRYRSVETGLPLIRSTNKGYSVLINPIGQIIESIPINTLGYVDIKIPDKLQRTYYTIYKDYLIIFILVLLLFIRYIQKKYF